MKTYLFSLFLFCVAFAKNINAQCEVDAGKNVHLCKDWLTGTLDSLSLNPKIISGASPFTYKWEAKHHLWNDNYSYASDLLNDTTIAKPVFSQGFYPWNELVTLHLMVSDSLGNTCRDSTTVSVSSFAMLAVDIGEIINRGDSVQFRWFRVGAGIPPLSVAWTPNYNISDTASFSPVLWPDTSLTYQMLITDSVGCPMTDELQVIVKTVGTNEVKIDTKNINLFPNPSDGIFFFEKSNKSPMNGRIEISDGHGKLVLSKAVENQLQEQIDLSGLPKGSYFLQLIETDKISVRQLKVN